MRVESQLDVATLLPSRRRVVRHVVAIALLSLVCGPLLGLYVFNAQRGEELTLTLETGLGWGLSFAFVAGFIYMIWLIRYVFKGYHKHMAELKMEEYYRATEGEQ